MWYYINVYINHISDDLDSPSNTLASLSPSLVKAWCCLFKPSVYLEITSDNLK